MLLSGLGGGGGGRSGEQGWWVSSLPPDGPLRLVARWDARGLEETVVLDGAAVAATGRSAVVLWPWEPDAPVEDPAAESSHPADGWFACS